MAPKLTREELTRQFIEQSDAIEKISKLNGIFSQLGTNPRTNINIIVQHTCELLQGVCSLYNRLDSEKHSLLAWADHNLPPDFNREDTPDGHICYEVTMKERDKPVVIGDIGKTIYQDTDTNVKKYGLQSYLGFPVSLDGNTIGALCIVDIKEREFNETEIHIISTLAKAVSLEEERHQVIEDLYKANEQLEEKVKERTSEIEDKNIALRVLMEQRSGDKTKLEESIMTNVKELIMPNLIRLKNSKLTGKQQVELNVLEANLNEIVSPFASSVSSSYLKLTPTEFQVANFIKHGATSKEIAESLALSRRTVDTHRYNIRKKFGLSGKGSNLRTYLSSIT